MFDYSRPSVRYRRVIQGLMCRSNPTLEFRMRSFRLATGRTAWGLLCVVETTLKSSVPYPLVTVLGLSDQAARCRRSGRHVSGLRHELPYVGKPPAAAVPSRTPRLRARSEERRVGE